MVSTKIQNNKTSASAVPSAEWNWIGDLFNSTTQNTSFTIGTGTITAAMAVFSGTINVGGINPTNAISISKGGTGATTASAARTALDAVGTSDVQTLTNKTITSGTYTGVFTSGSITAQVTSSTITTTYLASFKNYVHGNTGTATTINWNNGAYQSCTLTGNCTFVFSAPSIPSGDRIRMTLYIAQDATGSRTATWPTSVRWSGSTAPTLTTTGTVTDIATFIYDGNRYAGVMSTNVPL